MKRRKLTVWLVGSACCISALALPAMRGRAADARGYHVLRTFKAGGEGGWDYLTLDAGSRRLFISRGTRVMVLDADTGRRVGEIPNTPGVHGIALAPHLGRGFTSNGQEGTVTIFDLKSLSELKRLKVGANPDCILYDPATRRVFTFNGRSGDATAVDAVNGEVAGTIPLGGKPESAVTDGKGRVWVNLEDKSEILELDPRNLKVLHHWSITPGEEPSGLAIDTAHRRLFAVCGNEKMAIVDADTGRVVATPTIGHGPDAACYDAKRRLAFSSNGRDGTLTIVREEAPDRFTAVATVPTQAGARTMALDEKTGRIYLVTAQFAPAAPGSDMPRRRAFVPGSFTVLVVGQ